MASAQSLLAKMSKFVTQNKSQLIFIFYVFKQPLGHKYHRNGFQRYFIAPFIFYVLTVFHFITGIGAEGGIGSGIVRDGKINRKSFEIPFVSNQALRYALQIILNLLLLFGQQRQQAGFFNKIFRKISFKFGNVHNGCLAKIHMF